MDFAFSEEQEELRKSVRRFLESKSPETAVRELMETTDWDKYGTGNYEKCADCMVHSGYEATAVTHAVKKSLAALGLALRGIRTDGEMAPEISLDKQRPAEFVFSRHVQEAMDRLSHPQPGAKVPSAAE